MNRKALRLSMTLCLAAVISLSCSLSGGKSAAPSETLPPAPSATLPPAATATTPPEPTAAPTEAPDLPAAGDEMISQWAVSAEASSSYGYDENYWSVLDVLGAPNTDECMESPMAWAPAEADGVDWLEVYFEQPVIAVQVNIHETFVPGQIVSIELIDPQGFSQQIYEAEPVLEETCPRILQVDVPQGGSMTVGVRIHLDQTQFDEYYRSQIDAVELVGYPVPGMETGYSAPSPGESYFEYSVFGCREGMVSGSEVMNNSGPDLYGWILMSADSEDALLIYLPRNVQSGYFANLEPYQSGDLALPTAGLYLDPDNFDAQGGVIYLHTVGNGRISGELQFSGQSRAEPDCQVEVNVIFEGLPLGN